jgi:hypothetical protein
MLDGLLSGFARAYDDVGYFLFVILLGPLLVVLAIHLWTVISIRRFVARFEEMFPGNRIVVGAAAEVTGDDRVGKVVKLRSGWLQTAAVVVLPDRLEVWSKDAEAAYLVLDRRRLQISKEGIWVRLLGGDDVYAGLWLTDGDLSVVVVPYSRFTRRSRRALAQALADLGEDPTDHLDAV